jgi:hypothetical protein
LRAVGLALVFFTSKTPKPQNPKTPKPHVSFWTVKSIKKIFLFGFQLKLRH